jgi:RNA polymerase sigma-70 factor (ECF subfamily)
MTLLSTVPASSDERGQGEPLSFVDIFRSHAPYVWRLLQRLGATAADADDLCQEVFVVVHRRLSEIDASQPLRPWIYGVAVRVASAHRRRRRVLLAPLEAEDLGSPATQCDAVEHRQARDVLREAICRLDDAKREIFVLHELEELKMPEIAEALSCPLQTAYSRLHAARIEVKAFFARLEARETVA